ncbi:amidase signature enzyme, partial [Basidiobolus meristosporus CBS 931.73]
MLVQGTLGGSPSDSQSVGDGTDGGEYVYETVSSPDSYSYDEANGSSEYSSGGNGSYGQEVKLEEATIDSLSEWLQSGKITSKKLVEMYLDRIKKLNPNLHAVLITNQEAISIAAKLDQERDSGKTRGPLHGIPVLVSSSMETKDKMDVNAGSKFLAGSHLSEESSIVQQLRKAGAVILGKGNMGELNGLVGSNGYSTMGGQTTNPYNPKAPVSGSASGSAVAVAANLVTVAVGEDSTGSIIMPSALNAIVGMRPTVGLTSRTGNFLWSNEYDTYGPMARS